MYGRGKVGLMAVCSRCSGRALPFSGYFIASYSLTRIDGEGGLVSVAGELFSRFNLSSVLSASR